MRLRLHTFSAVLAMSLGCAALAEEPVPRPDGGSRPLLKQLNEETQSLYREIQAGVVRVQLPPPKWAGAPLVEQDNPVHKWGAELDPAVKQQLEQEQKDAQTGQYRKISAVVGKATTQPTTAQPATQPAAPGQAATQRVGAWTVSSHGDDVVEFRPSGNSAGALQFDAGGGLTADGQIIGGGGRLAINVVPGGSFTPNNIGLLLDDQAHILVPICVEKESFDPAGVRVMVGQGQMAMAHFVGSDRQTNITVLQLDKPLGIPVKLAKERPTEGTLTMFLSPNSGVGRLMIWTNELKDWGVVASMEGGVYGFTRQGQFLSAAACKPVIQQLIKIGSVRRATIGLAIAEVPQNDPARENDPALGTQPAVRVIEIAPNSPAAGAGLKVGDLILHLNDQPVGDPSGFAAAMSQDAAKTSVNVLRDGRERRMTVELKKE
jgi:hypothetical protein